MKLTKMSLVAALLVGSSAFADDKVNTIMDSVKVSGDVNLFYSTSDAKNGMANGLASPLADVVNKNASGTLFDKDSSAADASLNLAIAADLAKNDMVTVSGKAAYTVLSTLGLENNFVSNVWGGSHTASTDTGNSFGGSSHSQALGDVLGGAKVENVNYFTEAYIAVAAGNSALQLGRMELDTPLAFTEKWSAEKNTFEAALVVNKDIPDTTVAVAYVGNGNGNETFGSGNSYVFALDSTLGQPNNGSVLSNTYTLGLASAGVVNADGKFSTFGSDGAYVLGVVNNSFKPLTAQAWYYSVKNVADAYWLQADLNMEGVLLGGQYSAIDLDDAIANADNDVFAGMIGYEMKDVVTVKLAYSQTGKDAVAGIGAGFNTATSTGNTKLYTKTFWNYGKDVVTANDTEAMKVSVSSPVNGLFDLCVSYTTVDQATNAGNADLDEIAVVAKKSFGPLDAKLAYVYVDEKNKTTVLTNVANALVPAVDPKFNDKYNMVQAYLSLNF